MTPLIRPGHWLQIHWLQIGVAEEETNTLIGDMGWHLSTDGNEAELGITLAKDHHKKGHATRAIRMAMRDVLSTTKADRIIAYADLRNLPSRALMQRVGFTSLGQQTHERVVEEVFEFLRVTPPN
ncbi:MAG: GNAT family N-acetyltransferase [Aliishimia sp.]